MNVRWTTGSVIATTLALCVACGSNGDDAGDGQGGTGGAGSGGTAGAAGGGGGSAGSSGGAAGGGTGGTAAGSGGAGGAGAGGGAGTSQLSGLDSEKIIRDLTADEKGELCDWAMMLVGGYGTRNACSDGRTIQNYADRAQCVAVGFMFACQVVTVGDLERCQVARVPSQGCVSPEEECAGIYCTD
jgi:hypothetical protein